MVRGGPGSGKTTLCLHFLTQNPECDSLYISFDKNNGKIQWMSELLGLTSPKLHFEDLSPADIEAETHDAFDVVPSSELGLNPIFERICTAVKKIQPQRVVIEPLSSLVYLSPDSYQFRRQCQALFNYLNEQGATVLFTTEALQDSQQENRNGDLQFISDGIVRVENMREGRSISIKKLRGSAFSDGEHFMRLTSRHAGVPPAGAGGP